MFSPQLHTQQNHIETVLRAKQLDFQIIDIATDAGKKDEMREKMGDETAVAPQIFNGDQYCGVGVATNRADYKYSNFDDLLIGYLTRC